MMKHGLLVIVCALLACGRRSTGGGDPSVRASAVPSETASASVVATASVSAPLPVDPDPPPDAGKPGPPKFPLTVLPLGTFVIPVAKEIEPVKEIPRNFEPGTTKPMQWVNVSERTVAGGAKLRSWDFDRRWAWILTLERNGVQVATWRDIRERWSLDDTKEHMLVVRSIKDDKGEVFRQHVIIDLATLAEHPLPTTDCTRTVMFHDGRVIGYGAPDTGYSGKILTSICAFERDGKPIARLSGYLDWDHSRAASLMSNIGMLPSTPNLFYALVSGNGDGLSYLFTIDVRDKSRIAAFELDRDDRVDLAEFTFEKPLFYTTDWKGIRTSRMAKKLYSQ